MLTASEVEFTPWPKIKRLEKVGMVITEKIDGTNAAIGVNEDGFVWAQSRTRIITPGKGTDNAGFAAWVNENVDELAETLGPGLHFGEWWGKGIQRGYDLDEKRFSLFNTGRWTSMWNTSMWTTDGSFGTQCIEAPLCHVVPQLHTGPVHFETAFGLRRMLQTYGSVAAPGFERPEGICVYLTEVGAYMKLSDSKAPPPGV